MGGSRQVGTAPAAAIIDRAGVRPVRRASGPRTDAARPAEWSPGLGDSLGDDGRYFRRMSVSSGNAGPAR